MSVVDYMLFRKKIENQVQIEIAFKLFEGLANSFPLSHSNSRESLKTFPDTCNKYGNLQHESFRSMKISIEFH